MANLNFKKDLLIKIIQPTIKMYNPQMIIMYLYTQSI